MDLGTYIHGINAVILKTYYSTSTQDIHSRWTGWTCVTAINYFYDELTCWSVSSWHLKWYKYRYIIWSNLTNTKISYRLELHYHFHDLIIDSNIDSDQYCCLWEICLRSISFTFVFKLKSIAIVTFYNFIIVGLNVIFSKVEGFILIFGGMFFF